MASDRTSLLDELSKETVNVLRVRTICQSSPGIIATSGMRTRVWSLLLGLSGSGGASIEDITMDPSAKCQQQQVLEADVRRTRAGVEGFRSNSYKEALLHILQHFCVAHNVEYKQGMNEILAPFVYAHPPSQGVSLPYRFFEAFLFRYLERYFFVDEAFYLFKAFRMFHLLLLLHEPQLALHLFSNDCPPEVYAAPWFLTLFSRSLPLPHVLRLWDMLIAVDDPAFTFLVGLALLRSKRDELLAADSERIPEVMSTLGFESEEAVDRTVLEALRLRRETPRSLCRQLRLCCVSTTELSPLRSVSSVPTEMTVVEQGLHLEMVKQSARSCVMLPVQELLEGLLQDAAVAEADRAPQYVLIDIRNAEECSSIGAGQLPRAVCLEPEFLSRPEALDAWLQHFDQTRGCPLCVVDMPPQRAPEMALWKRLLLGERDGAYSQSLVYESASDALSRGGAALPRDPTSAYKREEDEAAADDLVRPAVQLARRLQAAGFPNVCVLDGGYVALVEQLQRVRESLEPLIINHDEAQWSQCVGSSSSKDAGGNRGATGNRGAGATGSSKDLASSDAKPPSALQALQIALGYASRLGHKEMGAVLAAKIATLEARAAAEEEQQ